MEQMESWVRETFAPVVLMCSTSEVERISQKNNLSFADLLNGFSLIHQADTPVRSVNHSYTLDEFNFRFLAASQFGTLAVQEATRLLNECLLRSPPAKANIVDLSIPPVTSVEDVPRFLRAIDASVTNSEPLPWYREFKATLLDTFRCEEYTMMCHPAVILLVVSSTEGNPRHCFEQLGAMRNLPPVFQQGLYDANIPRYYLVLHDVCETEGTSIDPDSILRNMNLPPNTGAVLRINSVPVQAPNLMNTDIWANHPFVRAPLFPANLEDFPPAHECRGCLLSDDDLARVHSFVQDFALRFVVPALEARIYQLNEVVSAMKKGVKNVFKSWLRKPKEITRAPGSNLTYRCDSIEAQTRLLADTAFMMRDYDLALSMYRLARDDYKTDKSMFHCANTNEMIALCLLLTKGSPMQMTNALDAASSTYVKINNLVTCRLAVRTAVIAGEIYNALSRSGLFTDYMDHASSALIRGSTMEQGICSAVLLERAAFCDVQSRVPKFRKFGFRLVMAGHVYQSLGLGAHSARCYALARAIYDNTGWHQVEDHINFTLAQQANRLSDSFASINLFLKLIGTGRNSASQQEALLYEFGMIVREFLVNGSTSAASQSGRSRSISVDMVEDSQSKRLVVKDLCMPELEDKSTVVYAPINAFGINRDIDGREVDDDIWKELKNTIAREQLSHELAVAASQNDLCLAPGDEKSRRRSNVWLSQVGSSAALMLESTLYRNKRNAHLKKPHHYAIGEKIYVELVVKNALSCAVNVDRIHVFGSFEGKDGQVVQFPGKNNTTESIVAVETLNLQLLPCSEDRVRLAVCPLVAGMLRFVGMRWSICGGDVHGEHAFNIPGPLLQDTIAHRESRARAPNTSLVADVVGLMPWLGVKIDLDASHGTTQMVGELLRMHLSLFNGGKSTLSGLQMCCTDLMLCVAKTGSELEEAHMTPYIGPSGHVVDLSFVKLEPGERCSLVMWGRGLRPGKQQVHVLFRYIKDAMTQPTTSSLLMAPSSNPLAPIARHVRVKLDLNLSPCLDVSYSVIPTHTASLGYILGISVKNKRTEVGSMESREISIDRLISISRAWRIEPFQHCRNGDENTHIRSNGGVRPASTLGVDESSTMYFRMIPREANAAQSNDTSSLQLSTYQPPDDKKYDAYPIEQFLCLEHAVELVKQASEEERKTREAGGRSAGALRSIQSVRRENAAMKANKDGTTGEAAAIRKDTAPPTSRKALFGPDLDAHLVVLWSTATSSSNRAMGQSNLLNVRVRKAQHESNRLPLEIALEYPEVVTLQAHGVENAVYFAGCDVTIVITNNTSSNHPPLTFVLELLEPSSCGDPQDPSSSSSKTKVAPSFFWVGNRLKQFQNFPSGSQLELRVKACFVDAGVYNLNRFCLHVSDSMTLEKTRLTFASEYLVNVKKPQAW